MFTETSVAGQIAVHGLMAEFTTPEALLNAGRKAKEAGYTQMDAYTPMPIEGLAESIGFRSRAVSQWVFWGGLTGACGGFGLMWWISVIAFPHIVAGRPLNSWPAYIAITFECMVLVACFTAVISMLMLNGLPQPYHPVFNVAEFERASRDRFFLCIEAADARFDPETTRQFLEQLAPEKVHDVWP